jgi:hypothetical protein
MEDLILKIKKCKSLSSYIRMVNKDKNIYEKIKKLTNFLDEKRSLKERLFNIKYGLKERSICSICKTNNLEWNAKYSIYKHTCSDKKCKKEYKILNRDPEKEKLRRNRISVNQKNKSTDEKKIIRNKIRNTLLEKYGVDSYAKTKEFKEYMKNNFGYVSPFEKKITHDKSRKTLIEKYSCDHNLKINGIREKIKKNNIEKWGVDIPSKSKVVKEKTLKTNLQKFGNVSAMCNDDIKEKAKKTYNKNYVENIDNKNRLIERRESTMLKKYGVKYWIQDQNNFDKLIKNRKNTYKEYTINENIIFLQGYENYALFEILLKKYNIDDIFIKKEDIEKQIGKIFYEYKNKKHRYYPDFYIKSKNKIYEIKSEYTYNKDLEINLLKKKSCEDLNINFEFLIIDKKEYKKYETN